MIKKATVSSAKSFGISGNFCFLDLEKAIGKKEDVAFLTPLYSNRGQMSLSSSGRGWSDGLVGFIYVTKPDARKHLKRKRIDKKFVSEKILPMVEDHLVEINIKTERGKLRETFKPMGRQIADFGFLASL
jgi:hypothetical protein